MGTRRGPAPLAALALAALACGSAGSWRPLDAAALKGQVPRTILVAVPIAPNFGFGTDAELLGVVSPLSAAVFQAAHANLVEEHGLVAPAPTISDRLTRALAQKYGLQMMPPRRLGWDMSLSRYWGADLALAVRTDRWSVDLRDSERYYRFEYEALLELVDARAGRTLASGRCVAPRLTKSSAVKYEVLMANDALLLKAELDQPTGHCVHGDALELLGLSAADVDGLPIQDRDLEGPQHLAPRLGLRGGVEAGCRPGPSAPVRIIKFP